MELKDLRDTPPWDWPEGTAAMLLAILRDDSAAESDLLAATEAAGDMTVVNDELVDALLSILRAGGKSEAVRAQAAISLGPVLEQADTEGFDDPDESPIAERTFHTIQTTLRTLYADAAVPKEVRRRILEASVRAPQDWHSDAVSAAWSSGDQTWKLTAVFCMRFVQGFDQQIVEALDSEDPDIRYQAVVAAGNWAVSGAWSTVVALATSRGTEKHMLIAAIHALAGIRPREALSILYDLVDSDDEDIDDAAHEALAMAEGSADEDDDALGDDDEEL